MNISARLIVTVGMLALAAAGYGQSHASEGFGVCKPVGQRTTEIGCWIISDNPISRIEGANVFWHLDAYPTRADAEQAKEKGGTVVESLGKTWLLTIANQDWRPTHKGQRIAEIGPLAVSPGSEYSALYMEAIMSPGMTSAIHTHSGPEAWYTEAGETCLETPQGKVFGRPGEPAAIIPAGSPMLLTATGTKQRRAMVLILHETAKPPTTVIHDWQPKGLCNP